MMPKDKLPIEGFGEMEAYLVEGRSIGGLSGSPAFVRNTVKTPMQTAAGTRTAMSGLGGAHLLGLVHGIGISLFLPQQQKQRQSIWE